ncbi:hypothetical protein [Lichenicoccus sp.]|uniref:hypothetical protein n=1 Tax=Lichenicoccus sp. TaxID=2781899 RepID=UPI003D0DD3C0
MACLLLLAAPAMADEVCRYAGSSDYGGRLAIEARSVSAEGGLRLDVRLQLDATPLLLVHTHYLMQEISVWHRDGLAQLAVNSRYRFNDHIVRQQWDVYDRTPGGLAAWRVQGKRPAEFRRQHPRFAAHWDPASFGAPWLGDYEMDAAARRPDLDLAHDMRPVRSPLALAFYWLRWLDRPGKVAVYLPGFKEQKLVELGIGAASMAAPRTWQATPRYPGLSPSQPSTVTAAMASDRHLLRLGFDLHGVAHSARASIALTGCTGTLPPPP